MRMLKENPRYHILSLRVSDEELTAIKRLLQREHVTVSDLMRDALQVVCTRLEQSEALPENLADAPLFLRRLN